jgi:hypothetical protein
VRIKQLHLMPLAPLLALFFVVGCGGSSNSSDNSGGSSSGAISDQLITDAGTKAKQAANTVVQATHDKYLSKPTKRYLSVCVQRGDPSAGDIPPNVVKCHIEAFYNNYHGTPGGYIWSEDWQVPVQNGKLGTPVIFGDYRIRNYLREDNKKNCTLGHHPRDCLPQSVGGVLPG